MTEESEYFKSEDFIKGFREQVEKDTWEKGLPMVYLKGNQIVRHFQDGTIEVIKKIDVSTVIVEQKKFKL